MKNQREEALSQKNFPKLLVLAQQGVESESAGFDAWGELGFAHQLLGNWELARGAIQKALSFKNCPSQLFELGYVNYRLESYDQAVLAFEACIKESEDLNDNYYTASAQVSLAQSYVKAGNKAQALRVLENLDDDEEVFLAEDLISAGQLKQQLL